MPVSAAWAAYGFPRMHRARSCGECRSRGTSSNSWSSSTTQRETSPSLISHSRPSSPTRTCWPTHFRWPNAQSGLPLITAPRWHGRPRDLQPRWPRGPIFSVSMPCISAGIATWPFMTTSQVALTSWLMMPAGCGNCLTLPSSYILILCIRRHLLGNCIACHPPPTWH